VLETPRTRLALATLVERLAGLLTVVGASVRSHKRVVPMC